MAGARQPTALVVAKGKKHFSEAELAERRAREVGAISPKNPKVPKWLQECHKKDFKAYARALCGLNIYLDIDADMLARYVIAHGQYLCATEALSDALQAGDLESVTGWTKAQKTYFDQCKACADALGLSVSSRCRLVVPVAVQQEAPDPMFGE